MNDHDEIRAEAEARKHLCIYGTRQLSASAKLARAWLAEHPVDSDEPLTIDWLRSVGWNVATDGSFSEPVLIIAMPASDPENSVPYLVRWSDGSIGIWDWVWVGRDNRDAFDENREWQPTSVSVPRPTTRGQLRRLCRALGVELKEGAK